MHSSTPAPDGSSPGAGPALRHLTWLALGLFGLSLVLAVASNRAFFADGAYLFTVMLEQEGMAEIWVARRFADYLFQLPASLAIWLGVTELGTLRLLFNIGCFLPWPLAIWLCWRLSPRHLWLVLLACAVGYLNAAFVAVGQHIVAHAFYWPVLFVLFFVRPLTPFAAAVLLACAFVLIRSYETLLILGPLAALAALWRAAEKGTALWQRLVFLVATGFFAAAVAVAYAGRVKMTEYRTYDDFIASTLAHLVSPPSTLRWSLLTLLAIGLCFRWAWLRRSLESKPALLLLAGGALLWGLWPLLSPTSLKPLHQHSARFTNLAVPLGFFVLAWMVARCPAWFEAGRRTAIGLSAFALLAQSLWQISATWQWQGYLSAVRAVLTENVGPVPFEDTLLAWRQDGGQNYRFTWGWALPSLSYALAPRGQVQAVLYMPGDFWRPFDPLDPADLPRLERYGIDDAPYRAALAAEGAAE